MDVTPLEERLKLLQTALMLADHKRTTLNIVILEARIRGISEHELENYATDLSAGNDLSAEKQYIAQTYLAYRNKERRPKYFERVDVPRMETQREEREQMISHNYKVEQQLFLMKYPYLRLKEERKTTFLQRTKSFFGRVLGYV